MTANRHRRANSSTISSAPSPTLLRISLEQQEHQISSVHSRIWPPLRPQLVKVSHLKATSEMTLRRFEVKESAEDWEYDDGVLVFVKAPAGQEFQVHLDTKPNFLHLKGSESGELDGFLTYMFQTIINYSNDGIGGIQTSEVKETYPTHKAAYEAAKTALLDQEVAREAFAEYEHKENMASEWPYGDDCFVHAVAETGKNFLVQVKAQPHSHQHHACKHHEGKKIQL